MGNLMQAHCLVRHIGVSQQNQKKTTGKLLNQAKIHNDERSCARGQGPVFSPNLQSEIGENLKTNRKLANGKKRNPSEK